MIRFTNALAAGWHTLWTLTRDVCFFIGVFTFFFATLNPPYVRWAAAPIVAVAWIRFMVAWYRD